jgi:hypothetical protein
MNRRPRKGDKLTLLDADKKPLLETTVTDGRKAVQFPECTSGSETITYVSIGAEDYPNAGMILYSGALTASRSVSTGIQPQFSALSLQITED